MRGNRTTHPYHPENLLHRKFGRLTAIGIAWRNKHKQWLWLWKCDCGTYSISPATDVKSGHTRSCGCLLREVNKTARRTHGATSNRTCTPEYVLWCAMRQRCENPKNKRYARYGGRGVTICERWHDFANFLADMGKRPEGINLSIERRDNDGDYEPGNCHWGTATEQARNTSRNQWVTFNGKTQCVSDWAAQLGMPRSRLQDRLFKLGWTVERALTAPRLGSVE